MRILLIIVMLVLSTTASASCIWRVMSGPATYNSQTDACNAIPGTVYQTAYCPGTPPADWAAAGYCRRTSDGNILQTYIKAYVPPPPCTAGQAASIETTFDAAIGQHLDGAIADAAAGVAVVTGCYAARDNAQSISCYHYTSGQQAGDTVYCSIPVTLSGTQAPAGTPDTGVTPSTTDSKSTADTTTTPQTSTVTTAPTTVTNPDGSTTTTQTTTETTTQGQTLQTTTTATTEQIIKTSGGATAIKTTIETTTTRPDGTKTVTSETTYTQGTLATGTITQDTSTGAVTTSTTPGTQTSGTTTTQTTTNPDGTTTTTTSQSGSTTITQQIGQDQQQQEQKACGGPGQPVCDVNQLNACGAPGQPKCAIDIGKPGADPEPIDDIATTTNAAWARIAGAPIIQAVAGLGMPSGGSCPTAQFQLFNKAMVMDAHCEIAQAIDGLMAAAAYAAWALLGVMIVLSA